MKTETARFIDLPIHSLFESHSEIWIKIGPESAKSDRYGVCNFTKDPEDEIVRHIQLEEISKLVLDNERVSQE